MKKHVKTANDFLKTATAKQESFENSHCLPGVTQNVLV